MSDKKKMQLGMNPSTASGRLVKDILWKLIVQTGQDRCCKCGEPMSRETFSIEHVIPWLDSEDPAGLYFDLDNISFSHHSCNVSDRREGRIIKQCGTTAAYFRGCRCSLCIEAKSVDYKSRYNPDIRNDRYKRTGK